MLDIEKLYYSQGWLSLELPFLIKEQLWKEVNSTTWDSNNYNNIYTEIPNWYNANVNFTVEIDGSNRPHYERKMGKALLNNAPLSLKNIAVDLIKTDLFSFFYNYYENAQLLFMDVWNGAEEIDYHCDTINGADILILTYLTKENQWNSDWGGQIEFNHKTGLYQQESYNPYDGLMLVVNNSNPLVNHKVTALYDRSIMRYTFSFYYKWN